MGILDEHLDNAMKEILSAKASIQQHKDFWKNHTLRESLYNEGGPKPQDVAQSSSSVISKYQYGDCYLLANLIAIAKSKPKFITDELIKIVNDNEVQLSFFDVESNLPQTGLDEILEELKKSPGKSIYDFIPTKLLFESTNTKHTFKVTKDEVLKLIPRTYHKALWPLVVEIAYAKNLVAQKNKKRFFSQ